VRSVATGTRTCARAIDLREAAERGSANRRSCRTYWNAARRARVGLGSGIEFLIEMKEDVWNIVVDPSEFETALLNLVVNARDALPDGGTITIRAVNNPQKVTWKFLLKTPASAFHPTLPLKCSIHFSRPRPSAKAQG
jgi:signal transduction histidine kinase